MEKELDPSLIKGTQTSLGKYVKRPPLTEKLLKKPPFRFLHDIITTVLKTTGFFEGLFEEQELVSENVKDRESKILFLNKVISVVGLTTGKTLSAKPSKIVSGQEADKTNELLQCLAHALDKKLSSNEAVKKFKEGTKPSQTADSKPKESTKKSTESKKLTSRSSEKLTSHKKDQKDDSNIKNGNKERVIKSKEDALKQESPPKPANQKSKTINKRSQGENINQQANTNSHTSKEPSKVIINNQVNNDDKDREFDVDQKLTPATKSTLPEKEEQGKLNTSYTITENELNSSSSSQDLMELSKNNIETQPQERISDSINDLVSAVEEKNIKKEVEGTEHREHIPDSDKGIFQGNTSVQKESTTGNSDFKEQDRVLSAKNIETAPNIVRPATVRPSSSRPGAPRLRDKHGTTEQGTENLLLGKVNIIIEHNANEEEEDNSIIIVEQQADRNSSLDQPVQLSSNQHGHLVQQILDSQKEFSQINGKTEIEWQFGAQKAREAANQEIEQVRFNIQALSRVANPLGRLLDHIQEDVEVMRQELQQWTKTYEETSKELLKQKAACDDSLLPLHTKNKQLDAEVKEKQDKIDDLKIVIHKNRIRIEKLLASGMVQ